MPNRVEIAGQIDINYGGHPPHHTAPDFCQGPVWRPLRAIPVRVRAEIRLEDGFKDKPQRPLHHAITDARNLKRADFSVLLRNVYPAVRLRLVPARKKVVSYLRKERVETRRLDGFKRLPLQTGGAPVPLSDAIGLLQGFSLRDMHEDTPKAMRLIRLRLSIDPSPQLLQTDGCFSSHPCLTLTGGVLTGPGPSAA